MECNGRVLEVDGDIAKVLIKPEGCGGCTACHIGSMSKREPLEANALNRVNAEKGDLVHLEMPGGKVIEASAIIFMIPFAGFIIGFFIGYYPIWFLTHFSRNLLALGFGFALLAVSYMLVRYLGAKGKFEFVIKEVVRQVDVIVAEAVADETDSSIQPSKDPESKE